MMYQHRHLLSEAAMLEPNLSKKKIAAGTALSISFENAVVGSQQLIDASASHRIFTRGVIAGAPGGTETDGVYDHATFGKVYRFNGFTYFNCTDVLQHNNRNYRLEIDFVPRNKSRGNVIWRSGDYTSKGPQNGVLIVLNQDPNNYIQAFRCNGGFQRSTIPGTNDGEVLEQVVITKINDNYTMLNKRTGITKLWNGFTVPSDTYLAFGAADDLSATYSFIGYLKKAVLTFL